MNRICNLFGITYPIIQGGMVWCSGWRLASAVSNAGGLGLLGAGSMHPGTLREHIRKCKAATDQPFGVNVPLMYPEIETLMEIIQEEGVKIVFTSAGNPKTWTSKLQQAGMDARLFAGEFRPFRHLAAAGDTGQNGLHSGGDGLTQRLGGLVLQVGAVDKVLLNALL